MDNNKTKKTTHKSTATSDKNRMFHQTQLEGQGVTQTTTVTINIDQADDCITSCFKGLAGLFKKGG